MLRAKDDSIRFNGLAPAGFHIIWALEDVSQSLNIPLVLTCGTDSHPVGDPHTRGEAVDISVRGLLPQQLRLIKSLLATHLGPGFTVLYEVPTLPSDPILQEIAYVNVKATGQHIHIQPKKGTTWPAGGLNA